METKGHPSLGLENISDPQPRLPRLPKAGREVAAELLRMGHVVSWSEPRLSPHEAQWYSMGKEALFTGQLWNFFGSSIPGTQGSESIVPPLVKGSKVEAIHTWCRSEGFSSCFCLAFPLPLICSPETPSPHRRSTSPLISLLY